MAMKKQTIRVGPSILAGDFGRLADEARRIEDAGGDSVHIDVMDGHFVPNLTFGPKACAAINRTTDLFLDVHLMIYNPFDVVEQFVESGADRITFHIEATEDVGDTLAYIRKCNVKAGLAICPETTETLLINYLTHCDLILMMTVHPGFGGQAFIPEVLDKIRFLRQTCSQLDIREGGVTPTRQEEQELEPFPIQVDGGINAKTARACIEAGASDLVAGTYLFQSADMAQDIQALKELQQSLGGEANG